MLLCADRGSGDHSSTCDSVDRTGGRRDRLYRCEGGYAVADIHAAEVLVGSARERHLKDAKVRRCEILTPRSAHVEEGRALKKGEFHLPLSRIY